jgi:galactokinase/mevalonate kinase-like predicted kinase
MADQYQVLLSLPPCSAEDFAEREQRPFPAYYACSDPVGSQLDSGGGTAWLLHQAWQRQRQDEVGLSFDAWLSQSRKLLVHAGGESRRTPAYAACGKALVPMPVWRWSHGQHLEQTLLELQLPFLRGALQQAPEDIVLAISSGDVLLRGAIPAIPPCDLACFGVWSTPDQASRHGVFFCRRENREQLDFVLQKPSREKVCELVEKHNFLLDTGLWLFSRRALMALMRKCGWDETLSDFPKGPQPYSLYGSWGEAMGRSPSRPDAALADFRCVVLPLAPGAFTHFGSSRELVQSTVALQNSRIERSQDAGHVPRHPGIITQNAVIGETLHDDNQSIWIENSHVPASWQLASDHLITGVPANDWQLNLPAGVCLDLVPVGERHYCLRFYGMDDSFRGPIGAPETQWLGQSAQQWFQERHLSMADCGLDPAQDMQQAAIFPLIDTISADSGRFLQWLCGQDKDGNAANGKNQGPALNKPTELSCPGSDLCLRDSDPRIGEDFADFYRCSPRLSASDLAKQANLERLKSQRRFFLKANFSSLLAARKRGFFYQLDLQRTARLAAGLGIAPEAVDNGGDDREQAPLWPAREAMFRAEMSFFRGDHASADRDRARAMAILRETLIAQLSSTPVQPRCTLNDEQILWTRSPVRLDLAGGWTDTPPQCLFHGGRVLNLAVELNGQPPLQCFIRRSEKPEIVLRSIDLGGELRIHDYDELRQFTEVGASFAIPKAALALCGFLPEFNAAPAATLREQLHNWGGGLELTMLAAVPKGSGLGTSSILAATILGALNGACGLGWQHQELLFRTLVLEQLLTTGGGWQDQVGGVLPSIKLVASRPGLDQPLAINWLPERMINEHANRDMLLYYTGITRVAKGILHTVARRMFLNDQRQLTLLKEIGELAQQGAEAVQLGDWPGLGKVISRAGLLNGVLDAATYPPAISAILARIDDYLAGAKLLGAGGGGYLLLMAKSEDAANRIRAELNGRPPNQLAHFVPFALSNTGMQSTRS